jgi:hypothetical protein
MMNYEKLLYNLFRDIYMSRNHPSLRPGDSGTVPAITGRLATLIEI